MINANTFEIFLVAAPGLETPLCAEALEAGFTEAQIVSGGVMFTGTWPDVWRANLELRGATRVLARINSFRAVHLAQLDKRARKVDFGSVLRQDIPVSVEAACRRSRIYHAGAAAQRVSRAINEEFSVVVRDDAPVRVMVRIEDDLVTISVDTSGEPLHKRGYKAVVNRAPMRETMAAMFLRQCGFDGTEPVFDPMCGSGTFVIEAAEIAAGLNPGRSRRFAFENLATFDEAAWQAMRAERPAQGPDIQFRGSDRDPGAIRMSIENAERAGVTNIAGFATGTVSAIEPPDGPSGLVIVNPPYGGRIGAKAPLASLYSALGSSLRARFGGWRVGIITSEPALARATGLRFEKPNPPVLHGGTRVILYKTGRLPG